MQQVEQEKQERIRNLYNKGEEEQRAKNEKRNKAFQDLQQF